MKFGTIAVGLVLAFAFPDAVLWMAIILFLLKILWNFSVPYELLRRKLSKNANEQSGKISLMPALEICLLCVAIAFSVISHGESWINHPKNIAFYGCLCMVISYIHLGVAGVLCGWLATKMIKR